MEGVGYQYEQQRNYEGFKGKIKIKGDQMVISMDHYHALDAACKTVIKISRAIERTQIALEGRQVNIAGAVAVSSQLLPLVYPT